VYLSCNFAVPEEPKMKRLCTGVRQFIVEKLREAPESAEQGRLINDCADSR
jgi:hypothetical protein